MCLGIPGRIIAVTDDGIAMGEVDFGGIRKSVCLAYTPEATVGDYVIVHVGFAITQVDEEEAARTLAVLQAMDGAIERELGRPLPDAPRADAPPPAAPEPLP